MRDMATEVLVVGGGLGGVAAALGALGQGRRVILTEESPWLGGQLTSQAVPADEHRWMETMPPTARYGRLRALMRDHYRRHHDLGPEAAADPVLNPGSGSVSGLCAEPRAALAAIEAMLAPYRTDRQLLVLTDHDPTAAETDGDRMRAVRFLAGRTDDELVIQAPYILDATEDGVLLDLADIEHVYGAESRDDTGELHAPPGAAQPQNQQSFTWCFAMDHHPGEDHTIARPEDYDHWRAFRPSFWPGRMFSLTDSHPHTHEPRTRPVFAADDSWRGGRHRDLWHFRRIVDSTHHLRGRYASDVTLVNWPMIDYMSGPILGVDRHTRAAHLSGSRQQSLSFLYWLQTECPRHDGGTGYPGLRPRGDILGSDDDLALRPYLRESRRIVAEFTVTEEHIGVLARQQAGLPEGSEQFSDSVGTGCYRIDLHPSTGDESGPRNYVDVSCYPFQIPLGSLIPQRVENLLPAAKNLGVTHITNGAYRLHPVEWAIGEVAGMLAAQALATGESPRAIRHTPKLFDEFRQLMVRTAEVRLAWPDDVRRTAV